MRKKVGRVGRRKKEGGERGWKGGRWKEGGGGGERKEEGWMNIWMDG
jgi:hypothetical protein